MQVKKISAIVGLISLILTSVGCNTLNPYTGESQTSKAVKGGVIGAAAGAVVGVISGDNGKERRRNALLGAGLGALTGGAVGYYMDRQEMQLRQQLQGTGVSVTRQGDNIILNMPGNITFAVASSDINADFYSVLNSVTIVVSKFDKTLIEIMGYSDSTGAEDYNQVLSEQRATSVSQYLISQGVIAQRLGIYGYGESHPIADNASEAGRALNRRVEIVLLPITQ